MTTRLSLAPLALLTLALAGCGGGQGDLKGTVTLTENGKSRKLAMGSVMVIGSDSKPYYGQIQPDGTYQVKGIPSGTAKVVVSSPDPRNEGGKGRGGRDGGKDGPRDGKKAEGKAEKVDVSNWIEIPSKYSDPGKTDLTVEIKTGENVYNVELKK